MIAFRESDLDVAEIRRILGDDARGLTDAEVIAVNDQLAALAGVISDDVFQRKDADLSIQCAELRVAKHDGEISEMQVDTALAFADRLARNAAQVWASLRGAKRERFQQILFPAGLIYSKKQGLRTVGTTNGIIDLQKNLTEKCEVAPPNVPTWNRVATWIDAMNQAERIAA